MEISIAQIIFLFFGFAIIGPVFFLPTLVAIRKKHPKVLYIVLVNGMFSWTVIGWGIALLWAFNVSHKNIARSSHKKD